MSVFQRYYLLSKPGIVYGNMLYTISGLALAVRAPWLWPAAIAVTIGSSLVIASACVVNNLYDRDIDARMKRTAKRPSVTGSVNGINAIVYACVIGLLGFIILALWTNWLTVILGIIAYVSYAGIYTYSKRVTVHSTLIGTIPGALPAVAGYTALSGHIDYAAIVIGVVVAIWQLPHFYAIAMFRVKEYKAAGVRLLSHVLSAGEMRRVITLLIVCYTLLVLCLPLSGVIGWIGGSIMIIASLWWLRAATQPDDDSDKWARKVFYASLVVCLVFFAASLVNLVLVRLV